MKAARQLRDKVARGEITTGALATDHLWPELVEYLQRAGLDYLIIDQEHGVHGHDLDRVRDSIYMPPRGRRRPGGPGNYWVPDFHYDTWKREVEDDFIVLPQIESRHGLEKADEIAAHEITTAIGIGPYDLSAELGVCNQMDHPRMDEAVATIRRAGQKVGKTMWRIGDGAKLARDGFHFLCITEPMGLLQAALAQKNREAKDVRS